MKKILNKVEDLVVEMCEGMIKAHPTQLAFSKKFKVISRAQVNKQKVSLISGGGSGHEPSHGGFVGKGMLDAAVCGDVFASPSTIQVLPSIFARWCCASFKRFGKTRAGFEQADAKYLSLIVALMPPPRAFF